MTVSRSSASRVGADLGPQVLDDPFRLRPGGPDRLLAFSAGASPLLLGRAQRLGGAQLGRPSPVERLAGLALGSP